MKNLSILLVFFILVSCGKINPKGTIESKDFDVENFSQLNLQGKFRVFYINATNNFINVETYPNVINNLKIGVKNNTLEIIEKQETQGVDFYNITIYSKYSPQQISISDSAEMNISSEIQTDNFKLNLKNNAKFIGSVKSRRAEVEMANTSRANFTGKTKEVFLKISDTANLIAPYWMIDNILIDSKNGNYAEINIQDSLKGTIKNTAKLRFYNDPIRALKIDKTANVQHQALQ